MSAAEALLDELLPEFDVSDTVALAVEAPPRPTWDALLDADLIEVGRRKPIAGGLGAIRMVPELASRLAKHEGMPPRPETLRLGEIAGSGAAAGGDWIRLEQRDGEELAVGLVGKFWRPVIEYAEVAPGDFRDFAEPGWAKTVYDLGVKPLPGERSLLTATMRTATTDPISRRWFRRYWTLGVGSGAHLLVSGLLELVAERASAMAGVPSLEDGLLL